MNQVWRLLEPTSGWEDTKIAMSVVHSLQVLSYQSQAGAFYQPLSNNDRVHHLSDTLGNFPPSKRNNGTITITIPLRTKAVYL